MYIYIYIYIYYLKVFEHAQKLLFLIQKVLFFNKTS